MAGKVTAFAGRHFIVLTKPNSDPDGEWQAENKMYKRWKNACDQYKGDVVSEVEYQYRILKTSWATFMIVAVDLNVCIPDDIRDLMVVEEVQSA